MTWTPRITRRDFVDGYARRSGTTVERLAELGREARPCGCEEDGCEGWMMVHLPDYDDDLAAWRKGEGPHPGRLSAAEHEIASR